MQYRFLQTLFKFGFKINAHKWVTDLCSTLIYFCLIFLPFVIFDKRIVLTNVYIDLLVRGVFVLIFSNLLIYVFKHEEGSEMLYLTTQGKLN